MDTKTRTALAALPHRLSALLIGNADAVIDAAMAEAEADTGLFSDLSDTELAEQRYLYRIGMLADEMHAIVADADVSQEVRRTRIAALEETGSEDAHKRRAPHLAKLLDKAPADMA